MNSRLAAQAVRAIAWYQRDVSPRKGFRCAYGAKWQRGTCSSIVKQAFESRGAIFGGYTLLAQACRCYAAAHSMTEAPPKEPSAAKEETKGFCATWAAMEGSVWCCFLPFSS